MRTTRIGREERTSFLPLPTCCIPRDRSLHTSLRTLLEDGATTSALENLANLHWQDEQKETLAMRPRLVTLDSSLCCMSPDDSWSEG